MTKILHFVLPVVAAVILTVVLVCFLGRPSEPELLAPEPPQETAETVVPAADVENPPENKPETEPATVESESVETVPATEQAVLTGENEQDNDEGLLEQNALNTQREDNAQPEQDTSNGQTTNEQDGQSETLANSLPDSADESEQDAFSGGGRWFKLERENFERSEDVRMELEAAKFKRRLPNGFGAVGIDDAQRAEIYRIQEEYHAVLTPLYQRADRLRAERDERIRAVLTDEQREAFAARKKSGKK